MTKKGFRRNQADFSEAGTRRERRSRRSGDRSSTATTLVRLWAPAVSRRELLGRLRERAKKSISSRLAEPFSGGATRPMPREEGETVPLQADIRGFRVDEGVAAVEKYLQHDNEKVREAAVQALASCATNENLPVLLKLLDSDSSSMRNYAMQALGRLKSPAAIDRLVELMEKGDFSAVSALTQIGPAVEPAMLKLFSQGDRTVRQRALQVLNQVGTKKSLAALEKYKNDADPLTKALVDSTIQMIRLRQ